MNCSEVAFCSSSRTGNSIRFRTCHFEVRILPPQGLSRGDIYVTQTFHLIPRTRSERISQAAIRRSFDEVNRFELQGRKVIALGDIAAGECARHNLEHMAVCHPSRRGYTNEKNAIEIAKAIAALGFSGVAKNTDARPVNRIRGMLHLECSQ